METVSQHKKNIDSQMLVPKKWWFTTVESKKTHTVTKEIPNAGERMLKILKNPMVASVKKKNSNSTNPSNPFG